MTDPADRARVLLARLRAGNQRQQQNRHAIRYPRPGRHRRGEQAIQDFMFVTVLLGGSLVFSIGLGLLLILIGVVRVGG